MIVVLVVVMSCAVVLGGLSAYNTFNEQARLSAGLEKLADPKIRIPAGRTGEHQELSNLAAYLMSDYSAYVNGEVITIDGGEWLKGAGEFNHLEEVTPQMWDMLQAFRGK